MLLWLEAETHEQFCLGSKYSPQQDGFKVDPPRPVIKLIGDPKRVVRTYPFCISVLRFQVNEQLLRIPIKQRRKVYDSGVFECYQALDRGLGGNDKGLIKALKEYVCSRERTSSYIKCNKGIFLPTVRISSRLACEPVSVDKLGVRREYCED
jgi:hypothetical protein